MLSSIWEYFALSTISIYISQFVNFLATFTASGSRSNYDLLLLLLIQCSFIIHPWSVSFNYITGWIRDDVLLYLVFASLGNFCLIASLIRTVVSCLCTKIIIMLQCNPRPLYLLTITPCCNKHASSWLLISFETKIVHKYSWNYNKNDICRKD